MRANRSTAQTAQMRVRAVLVLLAAVLAFLSASLRAPSVVLPCVAVASLVSTRDRDEQRAEQVESVELGRVPAVRTTRGEPPRPPRVDGTPGAVTTTDALARVSIAAPRCAEAPRAPQRTLPKAAKTHAELMVFLN